MTALSKPAVGQSAVDPQFGTTIRRVSNAGAGNIIKPAYSTVPAWNADESYLILYHTGTSVSGGAGHHLYNGKTYQYIKPLDIAPIDLEQFYWHATDPDVLYYVRYGNHLIRHRINTGANELIKTFSCSGDVSGGSDPMYTSWNSDVLGLKCTSGGQSAQIFSYRFSTNSEGPRRSVSSYVAPLASASGNLMFFPGDSAAVLDLNMNVLRTMPFEAHEHASLGRLADGTDTHNGVSFDGAKVGTLVVHDMTGATAPRVIIGPETGYPYPPSGTHISAVALRKPGWVAASVVGDTSGRTLLSQELVLANTNPGGAVCRVAHHRSHGGDGSIGYWAEPHVVISPSGTRLLFGSDWGGGSSVDAYVVELPSYKR
jgi:hypothetical protein